MKLVLVYMTAKDTKEARRLAKTLVTEKIVACANILDGMNSLYFWEGRLCDDREAVLIAKTRATLLPKLVRRVRQLHSYSVPCIAAMPITGGNTAFLDWVSKETRPGQAPSAPRRPGRSVKSAG